ncbi:MAG TPA: ATP-binding protein, partial [Chthoniobacterales bacterium]
HTFISSKFPLVDAAGNIYGLCGVSTDITDRKRAGKALQDAKEEAERANRAKSEFLSRMSHELRTPMNAILGFAQLLQMDKLTPQQHDGVGHILRGGEHLLKLINEVLDIARIEAGRISLSCEPVEIAGVIRETLELVGPLASERNVGLINSVTEGNFILVDRQRFKQVLINLVSNAIKYNRLDGTVTLKCEMTESRGRVTISDTGLGIAPARLKHLFTPFERLGAEHSAVEGTGLGLTVAKRFVEAMAGTIDVESQPGEGTTFLIDFPRAESSLKTVATIEDLPEIETNGCSRPRTVLYIEDNLSNFTLLERLLERRPSTRLIAAKNGLEGLTMARKHRPDLILLDVNLPDINGHDVLVCVHADPSCASIPVIVVSADATSRQIDRLMSAGAADYITKPLDVKKFLTVLDQVLPAGAERN